MGRRGEPRLERAVEDEGLNLCHGNCSSKPANAGADISKNISVRSVLPLLFTTALMLRASSRQSFISEGKLHCATYQGLKLPLTVKTYPGTSENKVELARKGQACVFAGRKRVIVHVSGAAALGGGERMGCGTCLSPGFAFPRQAPQLSKCTQEGTL